MSKIDPALTPDSTVDTPLVAHGAQDSTTRRDGFIILAVLGFLALWGGSVALWGIPGLYLPAVALVPVIWTLLLLITRG
ncbi:MAG: hypothetical protein FH759_13625 [Sediminimonas qiaohouensis]|uniref:Uncharacterized protein n=1 Tax=Sediminimonas qiaohouensis TaxID=552061 RepID=A0A7C9LMN8_9RHOB|nr:hypothetical protein [Sediminimonas qiaohouensis]MTJ05719.1 hypothetical protein [Sediminimonas qiaohouensis]